MDAKSDGLVEAEVGTAEGSKSENDGKSLNFERIAEDVASEIFTDVASAAVVAGAEADSKPSVAVAEGAAPVPEAPE